MVKLDIDSAINFPPPTLLIEKLERELCPYASVLDPNHSARLGRISVEKCFIELKHFLILKAAHRQTMMAPSDLIDAAWHEFILFTEDYCRFCKLLGGYIHHRPLGEDERDKVVPTKQVELMVKAKFPDYSHYFWATSWERQISDRELGRQAERSCCG